MSTNFALESEPIRRTVLIVDDHPVVRQGLALLINREPDLVVCGDAEEAASAISRVQELKPDIVIVDISLNGPDGIELLKQLRLRDPNIPILILSMLDESLYAERVLKAGANGYIMKQEATEKVLVAIRRILEGDIYLSERIREKMKDGYAARAEEGTYSAIAALTDRELEVFRAIGDGQGTRQIAEMLHISVKTVESYQSHIKDKLSLKNSRELVQHAIQWTIDDKMK